MTIPDYLKEIEYAVTNLLKKIWEERDFSAKLREELLKLERTTEQGYSRSQAVADSDDPDDVAMGTGIYWETYFGPDRDAHHKRQDIQVVEDKIATHDFSVSAMGGSILHYAKQGISIAHGGLSSCPNGRQVGTQALKTVIWQGRNQTIHFEDGNFTPPVQNCFQLLDQDFGKPFDDFQNRNLAFDVLQLLGWKSWNDFQKDLSLLT